MLIFNSSVVLPNSQMAYTRHIITSALREVAVAVVRSLKTIPAFIPAIFPGLCEYDVGWKMHMSFGQGCQVQRITGMIFFSRASSPFHMIIAASAIFGA